MPASKIQDEQEVLRWFAEGRTYEWMTQQYLTKYNIQTGPSLWGNFRARRGLARRIIRDEDLIPWAIKEEHRYRHAVMMLRLEARARAGLEIPAVHAARHRNFISRLRDKNLVIDYQPDTAEGFVEVTARPGEDLVREPAKASARGRHAVS